MQITFDTATTLATAHVAAAEAKEIEAEVKAEILAEAAEGESLTLPNGKKVGVITKARRRDTYSASAIFEALRANGIGEERAAKILAEAVKTTELAPSVTVRWDALAQGLAEG